MGFAAARPPACPPARVVTLCRALFSGGERLRRQMALGWRPLPCVERRRPPFFRAPPPTYRCVQVWSGGALRKKTAPTVTRPRVCSGNDEWRRMTSLSPCSLLAAPPRQKPVGASLVRHTGCISRIFLANHLHYLSQHLLLLLLLPDHYLPFLQPSKMAVSTRYVLCRPWLALLLDIISPFLQLSKNYQPNLFKTCQSKKKTCRHVVIVLYFLQNSIINTCDTGQTRGRRFECVFEYCI